MAITYPLSVPSTPAVPANISILPRSIVAVTRSPFSGAQQAVAHSGQWWEITYTMPPMARADAEEWVAFLLKLNGREGTFLLGDPVGETARGIATGTPLVNGASQTGNEIDTDGWTASQTGILLAGDYFSLGTGTSTRLYKVLSDADSNASGESTLTIWPNLRTSPADNDALDITAAKGTFRLAEMPEYSVSVARHYGISFTAVEAI